VWRYIDRYDIVAMGSRNRDPVKGEINMMVTHVWGECEVGLVIHDCEKQSDHGSGLVDL
jgi:hypothetical protein